MHICIIGSGASGWIACTMLKRLEFIKKITVIGSSKIPPIGVGESTTLNFVSQVLDKENLKKFVRESDAAVKYGVYYKNWSKRDFINYFKKGNDFSRENITGPIWGEMLANKDPDTHIHDLIGNKMWNFIQKNEVSLDTEEHAHSWHFDAGKFINFLKKINLEDNKVIFIEDTIIDCKLVDTSIEYVIGENNLKYTSDYFINCCGDNKLNEKVFKEEYASLSTYLLTNKAIVYPLKYKNKKNQFHPYTVAKTMNCGWRWITPTQSRIGTGYVFSDSHISVDEATNEFVEDIGDKTIEPFVVDFNPRFNKNPFKFNNCTIGMSCGFLEPLDAPGLCLTITGIQKVIQILECKNDISKTLLLNGIINSVNFEMILMYQWWCSFILHQYKTCWRNNNQFWLDHKGVKCDFYDKIVNSMYHVPAYLLGRHEYMMFFLTTAAKDIQWKAKVTEKPFPVEQLDTETIHHLDYIQSFYE